MTLPIQRQTLGDLLRRTRARYPDKLAIRCGGGNWTYAELDGVVDRLAGGLATQGVEVGDRVAVLARNSHAFVAVRFALARLGAVLVPVNFMLNALEARYILDHSGATLLCVDSGLAALGREASQGTAVRQLLWLPSEQPSEPVPGLLRFDELIAGDHAPPEREFNGSSLAQIIYTSGTESRPKGAMLTHEAVIAEYTACLVDLEIAESDCALHTLPLFHCAQLDVFLGPSIYVGATNILTSVPTPAHLLSLIEANRITSVSLPPTLWIALLRSPELEKTDLSSVTKGYYGAAIMPVPVLQELQQRLPKVRLWNVYGQTEMSAMATVLKPDDQFRKAGSAGRPSLNVETRVVDDDMRDVAPGEVGEIVHRSPQVMSGYYRDPDKSAAAFSSGWFHSGDLATMDAEGYITIVDRKKDMIKTGGENVASREVEEALYKIEGVSEVAVIGLPDEKWIEAVTAVIVPKTGAVLTEQGVIDASRQLMAGFKVPKRVVFLDALPKNPTGKVLKRDLRARFT